MRKKQFLFIVFFSVNFTIFVLSSLVMAGSIGRPTATIKKGDFEISTEFDITKRKMEDESEDQRRYEPISNRYFIKFNYGVTDYLNIFAKIGTADVRFEDNDDALGKLKFIGDFKFIYGGGFKTTFYNKDRLKIGFAAQIAEFSNKDRVLETTSYDPNVMSSVDVILDSNLEWLEICAMLGGSYNITDKLLLYSGLIYSHIDGEMEPEFTFDYGFTSIKEKAKYDFKEVDTYGILIGTNYKFTDKLNIGIESRLLTELAVTFLINLTF